MEIVYINGEYNNLLRKINRRGKDGKRAGEDESAGRVEGKTPQSDKVTIMERGEENVIAPVKTRSITMFFDSVPVDLESDMGDWRKVKKELLIGEPQ